MATTLALQLITSDDDFKKILDVSLVCFLFSLPVQDTFEGKVTKRNFNRSTNMPDKPQTFDSQVRLPDLVGFLTRDLVSLRSCMITQFQI